MPNVLMTEIINLLAEKQNLSRESSFKIFNDILLNKIEPLHIASLLTALKIKGESEDEISGAISCLKTLQRPFPMRDQIIKKYIVADCCGTGGDGQNTLNISTAVAIIASTQNIKIAKHGNKAVSSKCGASDVIGALGIDTTLSPEKACQQLINHNITFLHAPHYHPHVKSVSEIRATLKFRTIFNLLGPLINPVQPNYQMIGVYQPKYTLLFAKILQQSGVKKALVVHGSGTDECAIHDKTTGHLLENDEIKSFEISPQQAGLKSYALVDIKGGDIEYNKNALAQLLTGNGTDAYRAVVALNAGALFMITGVTDTIKQGVELAQTILSSDLGYLKLCALKESMTC